MKMRHFLIILTDFQPVGPPNMSSVKSFSLIQLIEQSKESQRWIELELANLSHLMQTYCISLNTIWTGFMSVAEVEVILTSPPECHDFHFSSPPPSNNYSCYYILFSVNWLAVSQYGCVVHVCVLWLSVQWERNLQCNIKQIIGRLDWLQTA